MELPDGWHSLSPALLLTARTRHRFLSYTQRLQAAAAPSKHRAVSSKPEESAPIVVPADPWRWAIVDLEQREACVQTREIPLAFKCVLDAVPLENMHSVIQSEFLKGGLTMQDASATFAVVKGSARLKFLTKLSKQNRLWGGMSGTHRH